MSKNRRRFSPEEKVKILKEHLLEKKPLSDVCDRYNIHPTQFYKWQKLFFEKGHLAFEREQKDIASTQEKKISQLEEKLTQRNEVVSELMQEYITLKKSLGEI